MLDHGQKDRIGFTYVMSLIEPASPFGREALRSMKPYAAGQENVLNQELQNIAKTIELLDALGSQYTALEQIFSQTKDIRASIGRIGSDLSEVDMFELKRFVLHLEQISPLFSEINDVANYKGLKIQDTDPALSLLDPGGSKVAVFHISSAFSPALADIRSEKKAVELELRDIKGEEAQAVLTARRASLAEREQEEELKVLRWISEKLIPCREALLHNATVIGELDLTIQKAKLATAHKACMPEPGGSLIRFAHMSSPHMESILVEHGRRFTPLSMEINAGATVITGANMGGKSVALKTLALNVMLIHYGFFPFAEQAQCPLLDGMHLVSDDLEAADRGLSSFGGEIVKLQEILSDVETGKTLVLLDEFARGTNPSEGGKIARGVCAYLSKHSAFAVMTTHYEGVSALAGAHYQVAGLRKMHMDQAVAEKMEAVSIEERVSMIAGYMDYGLLRVCTGEKLPEDAINICRLLGLKKEIIDYSIGVSPE
ncbi:MAG: hypothetical protein FWB75_06620 [Oscillospiraceae bacterium]|nr:hypothetical protein [Oscillospiraceae bacterium]